MNLRLFAMLSLLLSTASLAHGQVTVGRSLRREIVARSGTPGSRIVLWVAEAKTTLPNARLIDGAIIALYDPQSQILWWMHETSFGPPNLESVKQEFLNLYTFATYADEIVCFIADGRTLWVRTSQARSPSLEKGLIKVETTLPNELAKFQSGEATWFQDMALTPAVGQTFFHSRAIEGVAEQLSIGRVTRSPSGWQVEIRNSKEESKTVSVGRDFKLSPVNDR